MLPCPICPLAVQAGLWQNWLCGSIVALQGWDMEVTSKDARWTHIIQATNHHITVEWGGTQGNTFAKIGTTDAGKGYPYATTHIQTDNQRSGDHPRRAAPALGPAAPREGRKSGVE